MAFAKLVFRNAARAVEVACAGLPKPHSVAIVGFSPSGFVGQDQARQMYEVEDSIARLSALIEAVPPRVEMYETDYVTWRGRRGRARSLPKIIREFLRFPMFIEVPEPRPTDRPVGWTEDVTAEELMVRLHKRLPDSVDVEARYLLDEWVEKLVRPAMEAEIVTEAEADLGIAMTQKVAETIAGLDSSPVVVVSDMAEAIQYSPLGVVAAQMH